MSFDRPPGIIAVHPRLRCGLGIAGIMVSCLTPTLSAEEYFQLTGIVAMVPPKRAFVLAGEAGQLLYPRTLVEGQTLDNGAVVTIDERAGCVHFRRGASVRTIAFAAATNTISGAFAPDPAHRPIPSSKDLPDENR